MEIELSNLMFTNEDDIVPVSRVEDILNTEVANTFAGDDRIIENIQPEFDSSYGIVNSGTLNVDEDSDIITGISRDDGIVNSDTLNGNESNDIITGTASRHHFGGLGGLTIHSIKCVRNGADRFGPDDTYITINGRKMWGDYNMSRRQTRSVNLFVDPRSHFMPRVELFDKDTIGRDDAMGAFVPVETNGTVSMQQVHGSGSTYEVYYSFSYPRLLDLYS